MNLVMIVSKNPKMMINGVLKLIVIGKRSKLNEDLFPVNLLEKNPSCFFTLKIYIYLHLINSMTVQQLKQ